MCIMLSPIQMIWKIIYVTYIAIRLDTWRDAVKEMMSLGCPKDNKECNLNLYICSFMEMCSMRKLFLTILAKVTYCEGYKFVSF